MISLDVVRVTDEPALRDYQSVLAASYPYDLIGYPADPYDDLAPILTGVVNTNPIEAWVGYADGQPVVCGDLTWSEHDNPNAADWYVAVHPDHRRKGYGTAVLDLIRGRAGKLGRDRLYCDAPAVSHGVSPSPADRMATKLGARAVLAEYRRGVDPQQIDQAAFADLWARTTEAATGYSALSWSNRVPPEHHDDMAELMVAMSTDAPHGDREAEPEQWDAARYEEWEDSQLARGRHRLISVVRHDESGRLVGFTDLGRASTIPDVAFQWATIVRVAHRGHRLGMLLKLANLDQLRREMPTVRHLNTWNAASNTWMVAVNEAVGFRVMEAWTKYELAL